MYTLVSAMLRLKNSDEEWKSTNIGNMLISDIFNKYSSGFIKLTNQYLTNPVYLDMQEFRALQIPTPNLTFNLWLSHMGNKVITTNETEPKIVSGSITYCDAWQAGYKIKRMNLHNDDTENMVNGDLPNLHIGSNEVAVTELDKYTIPIVNGYLHNAEAYKNGLKVLDGAISIDNSGNNQVGLISFKAIGEIKRIPIKTNMLTPTTPNGLLSRGLFINLNKNIGNQQVLLSIGGYLIYGKKHIKVINNEVGIIRVDMDSIDLPNKLLNSINDINYDKTIINISDTYPRSLVIETINTNPAIRHILTNSTSFVILVDTEILTVERKMMDNIKLFSMYESAENPVLPMIDYNGKLPVYHKEKQGDRYVIRAQPQYQNHHNYRTSDGDDIRINDVTAPGYSNKMVGHFLSIRGNKRA